MTAEAVAKKQIERCRQVTGEQRLAIALELHEMSQYRPRRNSPAKSERGRG
jgi:hypothetical protein